MPTTAEYVQFSKLAYTTTGAPTGWTRLPDSEPDPSGYHGAAFKKIGTNEIVIAHRGTEPTTGIDLYADYQMGVGKVPDQYQSAKKFYEQVQAQNQGATISLTGHSLGGALAQLQAAESTLSSNTLVSAVTFNPYGSQSLIPALNVRYGLSIDPNATYNNITNHQTALDGVSRVPGSSQLGQMQTHRADSEVVAAAMLVVARSSPPVFASAYLAVGLVWSHSIDRFDEVFPTAPSSASPAWEQSFIDFARNLGDQINATVQGTISATDPILVKLMNEFQQLSDTAGQTYQNAVNATSSAMEQFADLLDTAERSAVKSFLGFAFGLGDAVTGVVESFVTSLQSLFQAAEATRSPLVLDLDGDGVATLGLSSGIHFDHDGNGFAELTGWAGKNDGLLVLDKNGNGLIDNGGELFGNNTTLSSGGKAANGFPALSELDTNADDQVNASDTAFANLRVWKDANSDGVAQTGELLTLAAAGVQSLSLSNTAATTVDVNGNAHKQIGTYTGLDGSSRAMDDVWFTQDTAHTVDKNTVAVSATIAALPDMAGFGNVHTRVRQLVAPEFVQPQWNQSLSC